MTDLSPGKASPTPFSALLCLALPFAPCVATAQALPPAQIQFENNTESSGIHFVHDKGTNGTSTILEEAGPGVCVADFDGDGWLDIYFVNGRDLYGRGIATRNALYRNNGDGTFRDVIEKAGVPGNAYGLGCVWGDYDNDGFPDLYVTQYGNNLLYHNSGDGTFTDATEKAGVAAMDFGHPFHTGATFFGFDRDGHLDLYAGGYARFEPGSQRRCTIGNNIPTSCRPSVYGGTPGVLFHNNGNGTFANVTKAAGMYQPNRLNLAVAAADYDEDGWPDLFVANEGSPASLYRNHHDGKFTNVAMPAGIALSASGGAMAAMCIAFGDYDADEHLDLFISDFQDSSDHLWRNHVSRNSQDTFFEEVSDAAGITGPTRHVLGFGGGFFDYDNDGWLDVFVANGHVYPEVEIAVPGALYKQFNSLFHNERNGKFVEVSRQAGKGFAIPYAGRGVAFADFDNDGNVDIIVANNNDPPLLLHNRGQAGNHFLSFKLVGVGSNRDAASARVRILAGGTWQVREITAGGSYLSHSDLRAHFGLGPASRAGVVEVSWPSGLRQSFRDGAADKFYRIEEGKEQLAGEKFSRNVPTTR